MIDDDQSRKNDNKIIILIKIEIKHSIHITSIYVYYNQSTQLIPVFDWPKLRKWQSNKQLSQTKSSRDKLTNDFTTLILIKSTPLPIYNLII